MEPAEAEFQLDIIIRPEQTEDDRALVYSSWCEGLCATEPFSTCDKNWTLAAHRALVSRLAERGRLRFACQPEHPDQIYGWILSEEPRTLHHIFVKRNWRRNHVADRLMLHAFGDFEAPIVFTVRSRSDRHYRKRWNLKYDSRALHRRGYR